ncbi:hypothetical protein ABI59_17095 [Acidobacteria bacterium Mor1]|nr:hypothetical protein ABI59_17095 [Acidobacteria bacterium Mor1]
MTQPRIFLVEDDRRLGELLGELLQMHGFLADCARRGDTAVERILAESPDLVLLDIRLPGLNGIEVCKRVRKQGYNGPILMLTSLDEEADEVLGLDVGADDYMTKPANTPRLMARIRALLRRSPADGRGEIRNGELRLDLGRRVVTLEGELLSLTSSEFDILLLLARHTGEPVDREELIQRLRGYGYDGLDRSIDLRISRLRKRLGDDPRDPTWIRTIHGVGYMLIKRP